MPENVWKRLNNFQILKWFQIAMKDLEIRGAGDLLGAEQSGFINEMGFETYQKLMQEALEELKDDADFENLFENEEDRQNFSNL
jgi:transcription-repair coupling factor (superfamily II helicase)